MEDSNQRIKRFLGVMFECCHVYRRIYINRQGSAYEGACPRCGRRAVVRIAAGGSNCRFVRAG